MYGVPLDDPSQLLCNVPYVRNAACGGINTAIGCIPIDSTSSFVSFLLGWGIGIGGGVAMLLIVYAGFLIITSSGDPQRLSSGKELLTAAISGILLLVFSVFVLRVIGVDILGLQNVGL